MYTTIPIPPIDTLNIHTGLWVFLVFSSLLFLVIVFFRLLDVESVRNYKIHKDIVVKKILGIFFLANLIAVIVSFTTGKIEHFANEPVIATMVGIDDGTVSYTAREGKRDVIRYEPRSFVYYEVDNKIVSYRRYDGVAWPKTVILYRNPTK